jgi:hypothetical protein
MSDQSSDQPISDESTSGGSGADESLGAEELGGGNVGGPPTTKNVYIFNTTNQPPSFTLNGNPMTALTAAAIGTSNYAASVVKVARVDAPSTSDPTFARKNYLVIGFSGENDNYGSPSSLTVDLSSYSGYVDVLLYVFQGYIVICDQSGFNGYVLTAQQSA